MNNQCKFYLAFAMDNILPCNELTAYGHKSKFLGSGGYANVYKYIGHSGEKYAVKTNKSEYKDINPVMLVEIMSLIECIHPNIVKIIDVVMTHECKQTYMVMEYCDMTLAEAIENKQISSQQGKHYMASLAEGLQYIHSKNIWHRDIKPHNILITKDGQIKIADFGLAKIEAFEGMYHTNPVVTLWWRAPEMFCDGSVKYGQEPDVWALGVVFLNIIFMDCAYISGRTVFGCSDCILRKIGKFGDGSLLNDYKKVKDYSDDVLPLLLGMLAYDPKNRISANQVANFFGATCRTTIDRSNYKMPYAKVTGNIRFDMISLLMDWLIDVLYECKLRYTDIVYTYFLINTYLNKNPGLLKENLQLLGSVTFDIIARIRYFDVPSIDEYMHWCADIYTKKQFIDLRIKVLKTLSFNLIYPNITKLIPTLKLSSDKCKYVRKIICWLTIDGSVYRTYSLKEIIIGCIEIDNKRFCKDTKIHIDILNSLQKSFDKFEHRKDQVMLDMFT